jgi:Tol biopolymer transport system component/DNA-binding winged helix-turn-helix (wHTH) protein
VDQLAKPRPSFIDLAREPGFRLGAAEVRPSLREVRLGDRSDVLEPRVMQVLVALVRADGGLLTRDDLIEQCWGGVIVGEDAITRCVSLLRRLAEALDGRAFRIETLAKVGYRLTAAPVEAGTIAVGVLDEAPAPGAPPPSPPARRLRRGRVAAAAALAVLLAGAAAFVVRSNDRGGWIAEGYRPIAEEAGALGEPALSPNGRQIAYTKGDDFATPYDVWLRRVDGGPPVRLTDDPIDEGRPAWSPDGDEVAYARQRPGRPCEMVVHPLPAGPARVAGRCRTNAETVIDWDRSGRALYFEDAPRRGASQAVYRLDIASGAVRPVTRPPAGIEGDNNPHVSPDGQRIAFERRPSERVRHILVQDLGSGRETLVAADAGANSRWAWSADGRDLIVARGDDWGLWAYPASGHGKARPVTSGASAVYGVDISGDQAAVLLTERRWNLMRLGRGRNAPVMPGLGYDSGPDVAASGALVLESERPRAALYVIPPGAPPERLELPAGLKPELPRWSPDGRRVAFRSGSDLDGKTRLYVVNADGTGLVRLPPAAVELSAPAWTADGRGLIYAVKAAGLWSLWQVGVDGRSPPRDLGLKDWRGVRTYGGALYAVREGEGYAARDFTVYRLDPGRPPVVVARCPERFAMGDWVISGGKLYILAALEVMQKAEVGGKGERLARLWVNDLDGGPMRAVAQAPRAFTSLAIGVDPKTGDLFYTRYAPPNQQIGVMTLKRQRRWF